MKKDCPQTSKFKRLAKRLGIEFYRVVGVLQSIWLMTETEAKKGDIGKRSNRQIAAYLEWPDDPDELIAALVECGWIDEDPENRLMIHDWKDHAPNYIKGGLTNAQRAKDREPRMGNQRSRAKDGGAKDGGAHSWGATYPILSQPYTPCSPPRGMGAKAQEDGAARRGELEGPDDAARGEAGRWTEVRKRLETIIDGESWRTWFDPEVVWCVGLSSAGVWLEAAGVFYRNWLANNYTESIGKAAQEAFGLDEAPEVYVGLPGDWDIQAVGVAAEGEGTGQDDDGGAIDEPPEP